MSPHGWPMGPAVPPTPKTHLVRCPGCFTRVRYADEGAESALYLHSLSGTCSARVEPKQRAKSKSKSKPTERTGPSRLNDWAVMADG